MKKLFLIALSLIWVSLFFVGLIKYQGATLVFTLFSLAFLILLILGFYNNRSYVFMYLAVLLYLGFWVKLTVHLLAGDFYLGLEPFGAFSGSGGEWDQVLWVSTIACLGVIIGRLVYTAIIAKSERNVDSPIVHPKWYPAIRLRLWVLLLTAIVVAVVVNIILGIHQVGLSPRTVLPWPGNAIISWVVTIGGVMGLVTLIWWDWSLKKSIYFAIFTIILEGFLSTTSLFSRGVFVFHSIPCFIAFYKEKLTNSLSFKRLSVPVFLFLTLFVLSFSMVSVLRTHYYADHGSVNKEILANETYNELRNESFKKVVHLSVDRWIGLEGVMAIVSYPDKGGELIFDALRETRGPGNVNKFQEIANSGYQSIDSKVWQFSSLPGITAFLYFSGSIWVVLFGMIFFTILVQFLEFLIFKGTNNPILCSLLGALLASNVTQFGIAPIQGLTYLLMVAIGVLAITIIQRFKLTSNKITKQWLFL